jgi:hypothetical protein
MAVRKDGTMIDLSSVLLLIAGLGALAVLGWSLVALFGLFLFLWAFTAHLIKNRGKK